MSRFVQKNYQAKEKRHKVYTALIDTWMSAEEIRQIKGLDVNPTSVRFICDHLLANRYIRSKKFLKKDTKRWVVKYQANKDNPYELKPYEQMLKEYKEKINQSKNENKKGKYDDLIASNPNLRVIKGLDSPLSDSWKAKKKSISHFNGIPSTFYMDF